MNQKIISTSDGFDTVQSAQFGVPYHSVHGALLETDTVFIHMGLEYWKHRQAHHPIRIFEMGFGTGLNAIRTFQKAIEWNMEIDYVTIEAYPLPIEMVSQINHVEKLQETNDGRADLKKIFLTMHEAPSGKKIVLAEKMVFTKYIGKIETFVIPQASIDLIYYDAFAPASQSYLWEEEMMQKMYEMLTCGGILCTYCAQGAFKRILKKVGFIIENLPGPGRKREITRAVK